MVLVCDPVKALLAASATLGIDGAVDGNEVWDVLSNELPVAIKQARIECLGDWLHGVRTQYLMGHTAEDEKEALYKLGLKFLTSITS